MPAASLSLLSARTASVTSISLGTMLAHTSL